jgi:hypothetical protein
MEIGKPTTVDVKEPANEGQIGGNHYKKLQIQPWDYILANNIGYCEASAIKYLSRWKDKGGIADLYKAKHFIDKLIEWEREELWLRAWRKTIYELFERGLVDVRSKT